MIDRIVIYKSIDIDKKNINQKSMKDIYYQPKDKDKNPIGDMRHVYVHNANNFKITYSPDASKLRIVGRLVNASKNKNKVHNTDDLYVGASGISKRIEEEIQSEWVINDDYDEDDNLIFDYQVTDNSVYIEEEYIQDLDDVISDVNKTIYALTKAEVDIREFNVAHIEFCFNLETEYVDQYITMFNYIFKDKNKKRHTNYVLDNDLPLNSSFYVETESEHKNKTKDNYTVNFYNKLNQLMNKKSNGKKEKVTEEDLKLAKNILRLEVQTGYHYLTNKMKKELGLVKKLGNFIDADLCGDVIKDKYSYFIDRSLYLDFYSYKKAKEKIEISDLEPKKKKALLDHIHKCSKKNKISDTTMQKYRKMLSELGIHYYFIPKNLNVDYLVSPMRLLDEKIKNLDVRRKKYMENICAANTYEGDLVDFGDDGTEITYIDDEEDNLPF